MKHPNMPDPILPRLCQSICILNDFKRFNVGSAFDKSDASALQEWYTKPGFQLSIKLLFTATL